MAIGFCDAELISGPTLEQCFLKLLPTTRYHKSHWPWTSNSTAFCLASQSSPQFWMIHLGSWYI